MTLNIILNLLELRRKEKEMRQLLDSKNQLELVKLLMTLRNLMLRKNLNQQRKLHLLRELHLLRKLLLLHSNLKLQNLEQILNQQIKEFNKQLRKKLLTQLNVLKVNSKNHLITLRKTLKSYLVGDK